MEVMVKATKSNEGIQGEREGEERRDADSI